MNVLLKDEKMVLKNFVIVFCVSVSSCTNVIISFQFAKLFVVTLDKSCMIA